MRVDLLGRALAETIEAVQRTEGCRCKTRLVPSPWPPSITVVPELGRLWVHLDSGHLTVLLSVDIREPAETAA